MFFAVFRPYETTLADRLISFAGIWVMVALAWLMSVDRKAIRWRPVAWGIGLQLAIGLVVLSPQLANFFFVVVDVGVKKLLSFSEAGATFVFQSIEPHQILDAQGNAHTYVGGVISPPVKTFAFWILPSIIFFSSLMAVGYHLGHHAARRLGARLGDAADDGDERRRELVDGREHLRRPDRGAAARPTVHPEDDDERAPLHHGRRVRHRRGRRHGRVRRIPPRRARESRGTS
jgi:hypothetical protein